MVSFLEQLLVKTKKSLNFGQGFAVVRSNSLLV